MSIYCVIVRPIEDPSFPPCPTHFIHVTEYHAYVHTYIRLGSQPVSLARPRERAEQGHRGKFPFVVSKQAGTGNL